jgi:hypothetical protein
MNIIKRNKKQILQHLYDWAETFNPEYILYNINNIDQVDEYEMLSSYEYVLSIAIRLENDECSDKDFQDILFHIEQINYDEIKILI